MYMYMIIYTNEIAVQFNECICSSTYPSDSRAGSFAWHTLSPCSVMRASEFDVEDMDSEFMIDDASDFGESEVSSDRIEGLVVASSLPRNENAGQHSAQLDPSHSIENRCASMSSPQIGASAI